MLDSDLLLEFEFCPWEDDAIDEGDADADDADEDDFEKELFVKRWFFCSSSSSSFFSIIKVN